MVEEILKTFLGRNKSKEIFLEHDVKGLLKEVGIPIPKGVFMGGGPEIPSLRDLRFPLVAKVSSSSIASKSDIKGVRLGLNSMQDVENAVSELLKIEGVEGVLIEEMAEQGREVI
ncbi:MAG TPA: acetate--CoA ligase family protein, partial [Thermodesulfovibrionales bacterium]|nr:acetate--CoA ligase family protein [Thermodesulfovibrionales bacterium]